MEMPSDCQPIEKLTELCTDAQIVTVRQLEAQDWVASHIMEYPIGYLCVWMIAVHHKTTHSARPYTHGYVDLHGQFKRYRPVRTVRIRETKEWYEEDQ